MKIDDLIRELRHFKYEHGNVEVEFHIEITEDGVEIEREVSFVKTHEGYYMDGIDTVKVCEIRLD